jgi:hypothetical protein
MNPHASHRGVASRRPTGASTPAAWIANTLDAGQRAVAERVASCVQAPQTQTGEENDERTSGHR